MINGSAQMKESTKQQVAVTAGSLVVAGLAAGIAAAIAKAVGPKSTSTAGASKPRGRGCGACGR